MGGWKRNLENLFGGARKADLPENVQRMLDEGKSLDEVMGAWRDVRSDARRANSSWQVDGVDRSEDVLDLRLRSESTGGGDVRASKEPPGQATAVSPTPPSQYGVVVLVFVLVCVSVWLVSVLRGCKGRVSENDSIGSASG